MFVSSALALPCPRMTICSTPADGTLKPSAVYLEYLSDTVTISLRVQCYCSMLLAQVEKASHLTLAPKICERGKLAFINELQRYANSEIFLQPPLQALEHPIAGAGVPSHLDTHCKFFADDAVAFRLLGNAKPLTRGPLIALHCGKTSHGVNVDPAHPDHVVTSSEEVIHSSKVASTFTL